MEDRRITPSGIGKYTLVDGLRMNFLGKPYVVLAHLQAPNDVVSGGNPQEMMLIWCPGVHEDMRMSLNVIGFVVFWCAEVC